MSRPEYNSLSKELIERIEDDRREHKENPYRFNDENAERRYKGSNDASKLWRPEFVRDTEKILHLPIYNRYTDKTQVFSLYKNDDITRRSLHVQLVSRIARNIGAVLGLNLDLIEAVSLGHDIGHTPFGHAGEKLLDNLLYEKEKIHFFHHVQSARVLDKIFRRNMTLQTLDGILCHNGEIECKEYRPAKELSFEKFDENTEGCMKIGKEISDKLIPSTLESCVVRICDIIAYLGKDRQDAEKVKLIDKNTHFSSNEIGDFNAVIINNMTVDIIENSYGKDYIAMSDKVFEDLSTAKRENYEKIYMQETISSFAENILAPMFVKIFRKLRDDFSGKNENSIVYNHHVKYVLENTEYYDKEKKYLSEDETMIVADFIASMTDDYFIDLYYYLFPEESRKIEYISYFK